MSDYTVEQFASARREFAASRALNTRCRAAVTSQSELQTKRVPGRTYPRDVYIPGGSFSLRLFTAPDADFKTQHPDVSILVEFIIYGYTNCYTVVLLNSYRINGGSWLCGGHGAR